jgi:hypothetical protein
MCRLDIKEGVSHLVREQTIVSSETYWELQEMLADCDSQRENKIK